MPMHLEGTPSDQLPAVLATGQTDIGYAFLSLSAREPAGRDAEYIEWHSLDHRPEQYRIAELRNALRLVSTPECRAARAVSASQYDAVDHVMTYLFSSEAGLPAFAALGAALNDGGRMPLRLPSVAHLTANLSGKCAAPHAVAAADVMPWRPMTGVYLLIEQGQASPEPLIDIPGVAGLWWYQGALAPAPFGTDARGLQISYCYLDEDPVAVAGKLGEAMRQRWASGEVTGLLAAPFFAVRSFEWARYLP